MNHFHPFFVRPIIKLSVTLTNCVCFKMGEFDALKEFLRRYEKLKLEQAQKPGKDAFTLEFQVS